MQRSLMSADVNFVPMHSSIFCVQCEMISENNTPHCLACGSSAVLSLPRLLGGSMRAQPTTHLIEDAELDRLVRSLLLSVPESADSKVHQGLHLSNEFSSRRNRPGQPDFHLNQSILMNAGEIDLEPGISIIAEKAQSLTGATGAAIALRRGHEIVCRARTGRTGPDLGVRLQTDSGLSAECVRTGEVLLCNDADTNSYVDAVTCRRMGVRSILVAPLRHFRRTLGVFEVLSSSAHAFDHNDVATMQFLSGMMVAAISRISSLHSARPAATGA